MMRFLQLKWLRVNTTNYMGSAVGKSYIMGVWLGLFGAMISAPIYGELPSVTRILITHPAVAILSRLAGVYTVKRKYIPACFNNPFGWGMLAVAIHGAIISSLDICTGTPPGQVALTFANGVLFTCYSIGLQEIRCKILPAHIGPGNAFFVGTATSMYLAFGFTVRNTFMNWNVAA